MTSDLSITQSLLVQIGQTLNNCRKTGQLKPSLCVTIMRVDSSSLQMDS